MPLRTHLFTSSESRAHAVVAIVFERGPKFKATQEGDVSFILDANSQRPRGDFLGTIFVQAVDAAYLEGGATLSRNVPRESMSVRNGDDKPNPRQHRHLCFSRP